MRFSRVARGTIVTNVLIGAVAGVVGTTAMTLMAASLFRRLPQGERYPLPPRELTERSASAVGIREQLKESGLQAATVASHFAFGAAAGIVYGLLFLGKETRSVATGVTYGLAVWTTSYLGWIPASRLLRPATQHPANRNALMIAAHVVWGAVVGPVADSLSHALEPMSGGPLRDRHRAEP